MNTRGHVWHVGDGTHINIWNDSWVPSSPTRKVLTTRENIVLAKVIELINHERRECG